MSRLHADALLLLCAAIWGLAFFFQKSAMDHIGPLTFIAARSLIAVTALAPLAAREMRRAGYWPSGLAAASAGSGALFFLGAVLQQYGLKTATVTNTGFLTALYVAITPLLAWLWAGRRPAPVVLGAIAMAFLGTWLLGGGTISGLSGGDRLVAIGALFWAAHIVSVGLAGALARPIGFTMLQFAAVGTLALAGMAATGEWPEREAIGAALPAVLYVGLLSSALTFALLAIAMRHTPTAEAAVLVSMETLFAALAGAVLLGERLSAIGWAGAALMFLAGLVVQLAPARAAPPPSDGPAAGSRKADR